MKINYIFTLATLMTFIYLLFSCIPINKEYIMDKEIDNSSNA